MSKTNEEKLVAAIITVNNFFMEHGLPAPISQKDALVVLHASEQRGVNMTRDFIQRLTPKPLTNRIQYRNTTEKGAEELVMLQIRHTSGASPKFGTEERVDDVTGNMLVTAGLAERVQTFAAAKRAGWNSATPAAPPHDSARPTRRLASTVSSGAFKTSAQEK